MKHRNRTAVLALAVMALVITGCASSNANNDYAAATIAFNNGDVQYKADCAAIDAVAATGKLGTRGAANTQYTQYQANQKAVSDATVNVKTDLDNWKATSAQPATYATNNKTLTDALSAMSNLRKQVAP